MKKLTKEQAVVISAYTGILICSPSDLHKAVEDKLGHSVFAHQIPDLADKIAEVFKEDFLALAPEENV